MCVVEGQRLWEMEGEEEEGMVTWHNDNIIIHSKSSCANNEKVYVF